MIKRLKEVQNEIYTFYSQRVISCTNAGLKTFYDAMLKELMESFNNVVAYMRQIYYMIVFHSLFIVNDSQHCRVAASTGEKFNIIKKLLLHLAFLCDQLGNIFCIFMADISVKNQEYEVEYF